MNSFFDLDNGIFTFLGKAFDVIMIGIIYLICCLPIVTIGPATAALYYTLVKVVRKNRGYITREFFKSFKQNFKVGTISWIIVLLLAGLLYINFQLTKQMAGSFVGIFAYTYRFANILLFMTTLYLFPVLSRFQMGVVQLLKTSFFLSLKHLPTTIALGALALLAGVGMYMIKILPLVAPAVYFLIASYLMERVLIKYLPKEEDSNPDEPKKDQWYLE